MATSSHPDWCDRGGRPHGTCGGVLVDYVSESGSETTVRLIAVAGGTPTVYVSHRNADTWETITTDEPSFWARVFADLGVHDLAVAFAKASTAIGDTDNGGEQ